MVRHLCYPVMNKIKQLTREGGCQSQMHSERGQCKGNLREHGSLFHVTPRWLEFQQIYKIIH